MFIPKPLSPFPSKVPPSLSSISNAFIDSSSSPSSSRALDAKIAFQTKSTEFTHNILCLAGINPYVTQCTKGQNFHAALNRHSIRVPRLQWNIVKFKEKISSPCKKDQFQNSQHDWLYTILHILRTVLRTVPTQYANCKNIDGTLDRQIHSLIHEYLKGTIGNAHRDTLHRKDPITKLIILMHHRSKTHAHKPILQRPCRIKVQNILLLKERLTQPISQ
mmetsp:Transcript_19727/g.35694  ORF Transcript_19727/g.35694 Transcript_19727/m.35694 type:complete len:219 (+) Transcript_19727:191-847(+)